MTSSADLNAAASVIVARELYEAQRKLEHPQRPAWADAGNVTQCVYVAIVEHLEYVGVIEWGREVRREVAYGPTPTPLEQRLGQIARDT